MREKINILQLCSYYIGNRLYSHLFSELANGVRQTAYIPVKSKSLEGGNRIEVADLKLNYSNIINPYHKFFYGRKIRKQKKDLIKLIGNEVKSIALTHAHTWFSDGGTAYLLNKKYQIPYIVNVRNTDINSFYKYAFHYRGFAHRVLLKSEAVVFISHAYKNKTLDILPANLRKAVSDKSHVIPNGIVQEYFNPLKKDKCIEGKLNLITISSLDSNKNIETKLKLINALNKQGLDVQLKVIGSGPLKDKLKALVQELGIESNVQFLGYLEKNEIKMHLDSSHIFILTSFKETFGIAYIEALARGLPIIYTQGQGVDGFFQQGEVGFAVEPTDLTGLQKGIEKIQQDYVAMSLRCAKVAGNFSWEKVAASYLELYQRIGANKGNSDKA